jgi:outer membrane protein TolC
MRFTEPRRVLAATACAALVLLAGCASNGLERAPAAPDRPWQPASAPAPAGFVLAPRAELGVLPPGADVDPAHRYTLPELVDLAQRQNPATRIAWNEARNAALAAGVARNAWLPQVLATAMGGSQTSGANVSGQVLAPQFDNSAQGAVGVLSLQWLMFDFGVRDALAEAAEQGSVIANIGFTAAHQQLIESVSLAFYVDAAARVRVDVAERSLANSRAVLQAAEARLAQGRGTVIEVAQARQGVAQAELARVQAQGAARDAEHRLIAAVGLSPMTRLQRAEATMPKLDSDLAAPLERIVADALARRPDVQAAHAALLAGQAGVKGAEAARLPKLFLSASASRGSGASSIGVVPGVGPLTPSLNLSGDGTGAGVFVGVTVPLFDGGLGESLTLQAQQRADIAQSRLDRVRQQAVLQIVVAQDTLRSALAAAEAAQTLQTTAAITYDAALDAYRSGLGTVTAVALADTQMLLAGQTLADARAAAQSAAVTLALATGALGTAPR